MREHIVPANRGLNRGLHIIQRHGTLALSISWRKISSRSQKARFLIGSNPCCCKCKSWACRYEGKCAQSTSDKVGDLNPTPRRFSKVKGTQRVGKVLLENGLLPLLVSIHSGVILPRYQLFSELSMPRPIGTTALCIIPTLWQNGKVRLNC
ncbi:Signal recognition particle receptor beta subunit [Macrophomina phaseolina MS6]|uniref:Signal recognition particle receptor beta subunit n=1 Tax=Macrophomina phaseolina (strain MS6) TaxID=1126212 RepID=K2QK64_MACPH|nr:Signal recognition particle receptor beta subunit [Macrophomina phaseolina MS6]